MLYVFYSPKTMTLIEHPSLDHQTGLGQLDKLSNNFQKSYSFKKSYGFNNGLIKNDCRGFLIKVARGRTFKTVWCLMFWNAFAAQILLHEMPSEYEGGNFVIFIL